MMFERQMPFSLEAEQAVLGSVLIDPAAMDEVSEIIGREDFHLPEHGEIFSAMREMYGRSRSIDVVLLLDELVRQGTYDAAGGEAYVRVLAEAVPVASHAAEYAAIVRDKAALRRVIAISEAMADAAYSGEEAAETVIERAEELVWGLGEKREKTGFTHIRDAIVQVYNRLHEIQTNPGKAMGMPTGFGGLDNAALRKSLETYGNKKGE